VPSLTIDLQNPHRRSLPDLHRSDEPQNSSGEVHSKDGRRLFEKGGRDGWERIESKSHKALGIFSNGNLEYPNLAILNNIN